MPLAPTYKGDSLTPLKLIGICDLSISVDREDGQKCYYTVVCFCSCIDSERSFFLEGSLLEWIIATGDAKEERSGFKAFYYHCSSPK